MKQILSLFITSLALCTACSSPKGSDTVQVAETTTEQTIQKASSAIHYNAFSYTLERMPKICSIKPEIGASPPQPTKFGRAMKPGSSCSGA